MEFVRETCWGDPVLGKYKYVQSSENSEHIMFSVDPYYDETSGRWFGEFKYTYCTYEGFEQAADGDEMDKFGFWSRHPAAKVKESYYDWCYGVAAKVIYHIAEYDGDHYRCVELETEMSEATFQKMEQMLLNWHRGSTLKVDDVIIQMGPWMENPFTCQKLPDMADNTAEHIRCKASVDMDMVVRDLQIRTSIADCFIKKVAEIICENYGCLLAEPGKNDSLAAVLYERVTQDAYIKDNPWMFCDLKEVLLEPIPFA